MTECKDIDFCEIAENGGPPECICEHAGNCPIYQQLIHAGIHAQCKSKMEHRRFYWKLFRPDYSEEGKRAQKEALIGHRAKARVGKAIDELKSGGIDIENLDKEEKGFGDMVSSVLSKFGITKEVMSRVAGMKDCGCDKRQEWLNKVFGYKEK